MLVSDLKFKTFKAKGEPVKAALVTDEVQVVTSDGIVSAHAGQYVVVIGTTKVTNAGPHTDRKTGEVSFGAKEVDAPLYGVLSADEFGYTYLVDDAPASAEGTKAE